MHRCHSKSVLLLLLLLRNMRYLLLSGELMTVLHYSSRTLLLQQLLLLMQAYHQQLGQLVVNAFAGPNGTDPAAPARAARDPRGEEMSLEGPLNAALEVPSRALAAASERPQAAFSLQLKFSLLQDGWWPCTILRERDQDPHDY